MSQDVLAIIPARAGSKGIPNKNIRELCGLSPLQRAVRCVHLALRQEPVVTSDLAIDHEGVYTQRYDTHTVSQAVHWIRRPSELARDDTPMIDVVKHVLEEVPGPEDQIILLVQPTQPLRKPEHVRQAVALMRDGCDRVMSVTTVDSPDKLLRLNDFGILVPWGDRCVERRQDARPAVKRDGTVYAFRRADDNPLGLPAVPLIIPSEETCPLDTLTDWAEAERRLRDLSAVS